MSGIAMRARDWARRQRTDTRVLRSLSNIGWSGSEKVLRMVIGLFVGLWVARYLQSQAYGQLQFALSWVGLFNAIAWLGVGDTVLRDLVQRPQDEGHILGTALLLRVAGSLLAAALAFAGAAWLHPGDTTFLLIVFALCLAIPFAEAPAGVFLWFQAQGRLRGPMVAVNATRLAAALAKVGLIVAGLGVLSFAWVGTAEAVIICIAIFGIYRFARPQRSLNWSATAASAWQMLWVGAPLALAALATSLNSRMDQLMLGWLTNFQQVGVYAAASRFSEIWWVIPPMLLNAIAPSYIYCQAPDARIRRNIAWITAAMLPMAIAAALLVTACSGPLVRITLGPGYAGAAGILSLHVWLTVFMFFDAPMTQYLVATHRQRYVTLKVSATLALNIALNAWLVPRHGALGAALATLLATGVVSIAFFGLLRRTRDVAALQREALRLMVVEAPKLAFTKLRRHSS